VPGRGDPGSSCRAGAGPSGSNKFREGASEGVACRKHLLGGEKPSDPHTRDMTECPRPPPLISLAGWRVHIYKFHRNLGVGRDLYRLSSLSALNEQRHPQLDQVAQSLVLVSHLAFKD